MRLGRAGISVDAMLTRKIGDLIGPLTELQVSTDSELGCRLLRVILARLSALCELELQHLSLTRSAKSLSQGEFRRAVLVSNLGGAFSRLLYLVDEPTIGLDSIGVETVLAFLRNLVTQGHTVITVEHDELVISNSDYIIELGTGGGPFGGKVVFQGLPEQRIQVGVKSDLETAQLVAEQPPSPPAATLKARGVSKYNLPPRDIDLQINRLTVLSGSSGSGKSTTIMDCLASAIRRSNQRRNASNRGDLGAAELALLGIGSLEGADQFNRVICCEGLPSGVSNRTSVASMIGVFNPILELYAKTSEGRIRGLGLRELRRAVVSGDEATLGSIKFRGWSLTAVLQLSIGEARGLFGRIPSISKCLSIASDVGLDYLCLSDRAIDCSVGEQQRMRLVEPLSTKKMEKTLLLLDEPSCGLGAAEVIKLISTIRRTIRDGATVLVIEHHPLFIAAGDVHIRF